jgi:methylmalonyl-CoA mutase
MSLESYDTLFNEFKTVTPEEWKNKIIKDLKGEQFEKLIWHTNNEIDVLPFYTREDNQKYQLNIPEKQNKNWLITEKIAVNDVATANKNAIFALEGGANAILFDLQNQSFTSAQINTLIKNILFEIAPVTFVNFISDNKIMLESEVHNSCPDIVKIPPLNSVVDELVFALKETNQTDLILNHFHFYISQNYFFEIAKLRAFRWLWKQLSELKKQSGNVFIQSETNVHQQNDKEEYTNMLCNTTEAMSAILGGCDSLIINSHDSFLNNTDFGKRIARNINHILQQESYFNELNDIAKGSYYIEYLTYQLSKKSWEKFTKL